MDVISNYVKSSEYNGRVIKITNVNLTSKGWLKGIKWVDFFPYGNTQYLHSVLFF